MELRGYIEDGEKMIDAVVRVSTLAAQNGFNAYAICCRTCNETLVQDKGGYSCHCTRMATKLDFGHTR